MPMHVETHGNTTVAYIEGECTIYSASEFRQTLVPVLIQAKSLEIDLSAVEEIDTAGVQLLLALKREAARLKKELLFSHHSPMVIGIIDLYNLAGEFGDPVFLPGAR